MDALMTVMDGAADQETSGLLAWLREDRHVQGPVGPVPRQAGPEYLGAAVDILVAGLGSGGAAVALIKSLTAWFQTRGPQVSVDVRTERGHVKVTTRNLSDAQVASLLERILRDDEPTA